MNSLPALMLFDSGVSQSLMSCSFRRDFGMSISELECLLRVSIAKKHVVSASRVYQGFVRHLGLDSIFSKGV